MKQYLTPIHIDRKYLNKLRLLYAKAVEVGKTDDDVITIDGNEYVMGYLKYLIQYAESRLNPSTRKEDYEI